MGWVTCEEVDGELDVGRGGAGAGGGGRVVHRGSDMDWFHCVYVWEGVECQERGVKIQECSFVSTSSINFCEILNIQQKKSGGKSRKSYFRPEVYL
jgi:hypothetical protein